jgi:hypothetical protein
MGVATLSGCSVTKGAAFLRLSLSAFALALAAAGPAAAQATATTVPLNGLADGAPIERVEVVLAKGSGNPARDDGAVARIRADLSGLEGRAFSRGLIDGRLGVHRARLGPGVITYRVLPAANPAAIVLRVEVDTQTGSLPDQVTGVLAGRHGDAPLLWRSDRAMLTGILGGGLGVYSDGNPWFGVPATFNTGSPIGGSFPGRQPVWHEGYVEYGFGGAAQLGDSPFYGYGAITGLTSWSVGQDPYQDKTRSYTDLEKAYLGLIYVDPVSGASVNASVGRQNITLNDGFLIHFVRGSANVGERGGTYLGPRNANDVSINVDGRFGPFSLKAFYIDPNELERIESNTTFAGINLGYRIMDGWTIDASYIGIPQSGSRLRLPGDTSIPREGVQTVSAHSRWTNAFAVQGLWLESEIAHQFHDSASMSAWSGYGLIGYRASLPWSPSLSYRYFRATGDDASTPTYERFDPLLSTGLGNWLQGISFGKLTTNSNLITHRLQFNVAPTPMLNVTFDWHLLRADELNNLGSNPALATLSSKDIGQEFTLSARWAINANLFLQNVASVAVPGRALREIGADKSWTTLQSSLYWTW